MKTFGIGLVILAASAMNSFAFADSFEIECEGHNFLRTRTCSVILRLQSFPELGNQRIEGSGELQCNHRDVVVNRSTLNKINTMGIFPKGFVLTAKADLGDGRIPRQGAIVKIESTPKHGDSAEVNYYDGSIMRTMKLSCDLRTGD